MDLKASVCSIKLAKILKLSGVPQRSFWHWNSTKILSMEKGERSISAFTTEELGILLPAYIDFNLDKWDLTIAKEEQGWIVGYMNSEMAFLVVEQNENEVEARAELLYNIIQSELIVLLSKIKEAA